MKSKNISHTILECRSFRLIKPTWATWPNLDTSQLPRKCYDLIGFSFGSLSSDRSSGFDWSRKIIVLSNLATGLSPQEAEKFNRKRSIPWYFWYCRKFLHLYTILLFPCTVSFCPCITVHETLCIIFFFYLCFVFSQWKCKLHKSRCFWYLLKLINPYWIVNKYDRINERINTIGREKSRVASTTYMTLWICDFQSLGNWGEENIFKVEHVKSYQLSQFLGTKKFPKTLTFWW